MIAVAPGQVWEVGEVGERSALFLVTRYSATNVAWMAIGLDLPEGWSPYRVGEEITFLINEPHSNMRLVL